MSASMSLQTLAEVSNTTVSFNPNASPTPSPTLGSTGRYELSELFAVVWNKV